MVLDRVQGQNKCYLLTWKFDLRYLAHSFISICIIITGCATTSSHPRIFVTWHTPMASKWPEEHTRYWRFDKFNELSCS